MALTLGITGMDGATESELQAAFKAANADTGNRWTLVRGDDADYVLIDMDSLYGPMSWLRLHAAGRKVIGLTDGERSQTDYRLPRPVGARDLAVLLSEIAAEAGAAPAPQAAPVAAAPAAAADDGAESPPAGSTPAPSPADTLPAAQAAPVDITEAAPPLAPAMAAVVEPPAPAPEPEPEPEPAPPVAADRTLHDWLAGGDLPPRLRLQRDGQPNLLLDTIAKTWHGPVALKSVAPVFAGTWRREDFGAPDDATWASEAAALGEAQPLSRLHWLGGLVSGGGQLLPGLDPDGQYRLKKWPQTEREYPKHFRIATAMMKGPASVAEVAEASGVAREDVCDFVNANLATGYAEPVSAPAPEPDAPPPKPAGLFGRMRGR